MKPIGSILISSMLVIAVSCIAGVWYEVKTHAMSKPTTSVSGKLYRNFDSYEDRQPSAEPLKWMPTDVPGVETIGGGDAF